MTEIVIGSLSKSHSRPNLVEESNGLLIILLVMIKGTSETVLQIITILQITQTKQTRTVVREVT